MRWPRFRSVNIRHRHRTRFLWLYFYLLIMAHCWSWYFVTSPVLPYATEATGAQGSFNSTNPSKKPPGASGANRSPVLPVSSFHCCAPALQSGYFLLFIAYFREIAAAVLIYTASMQALSISNWAFLKMCNGESASALSIMHDELYHGRADGHRVTRAPFKR